MDDYDEDYLEDEEGFDEDDEDYDDLDEYDEFDEDNSDEDDEIGEIDDNRLCELENLGSMDGQQDGISGSYYAGYGMSVDDLDDLTDAEKDAYESGYMSGFGASGGWG